MTTPIKNVVLASAGGAIGPALLTALQASPFKLTVFVRSGSKTELPSSVNKVTVDYRDPSSLKSALASQDAVVSTLGYLAEPEQDGLIEAAAAAGVKRFIPSEFGIDLLNSERGKKLPVFAGKVAAQKKLDEIASRPGGMTYTVLANGLFFDWGLQMGIIADIKNKKAQLFDGGDRPFSVTRTKTVGKAVVAVLERFEKTKNRVLRIQEAQITQNQIIGVARKLDGTGEWQTETVDTKELEDQGHQELSKSDADRDPNWRYLFIKRGIWGEGHGGDFAHSHDNEDLGVGELSSSDIEDLVKYVSGK